MRIVEISVSDESTRIVVFGLWPSYDGKTMPVYVSDQANPVQESILKKLTVKSYSKQK